MAFNPDSTSVVLPFVTMYLDMSSIYSLSCVSKFYSNTTYKLDSNNLPVHHDKDDSRCFTFNDLRKIAFDAVSNGYSKLFFELCVPIDLSRISMFYTNRFCVKAASIGSISFDILKTMHNSNPSIINNRSVVNAAAKNGWLDGVKWLCENECTRTCTLDSSTSNFAVESGNVDVLKYLKSRNCPWYEGTTLCTSAARYNHLDMLKYLHVNHREWGENACTNAAQNGNLEMLRYLHENGCPWDGSSWPFIMPDTLQTNTLQTKASYDEIVKYLRENDCPCNATSCANAAITGDLDLVKWFHENGCPLHVKQFI